MSLGQAGRNAASNVRRLREGQRLTYAELARRLTERNCPIPVLGLRRIERGERRIDVDDLVALAEIFQVEPVELLAEESSCRSCGSEPPRGFTCNVCGAGANGVKRQPDTPPEHDAATSPER